jgi:hypothetical protein
MVERFLKQSRNSHPSDCAERVMCKERTAELHLDHEGTFLLFKAQAAMN